MPHMDEQLLYKVGDVVPESGEYECMACGSRVFFEKGDTFPTCDACGAGTELASFPYDTLAAEFWQQVPH